MEVLYSSGQKRRERNTCDRMDIVANLAVAVDSVGCRNKIIAFLPEGHQIRWISAERFWWLARVVSTVLRQKFMSFT